MEWISVDDRLPEIGTHVTVITNERWWSTPSGISDMNVSATGYISNIGNVKFWSIFGERAMPINSFTHWLPLPDVPHAT